MNNYNQYDVLEAREKRSQFQEYLLKKYGNTVVCLRVNYPGVNKDNKLSKNIMLAIEKILCDMYEESIISRVEKRNAEGPVSIFVIKINAIEVKKRTVEIEEKHILGRCVDIDVYDPNTLKSISRTELNLPERKCFLCDENAKVCVRAQRHSTQDVIKYIENCYSKYMEKFYDYK